MNIVKYPGGKERELNTIMKHLPEGIKNYYEPFVGGGSVFLGMKADHYYINDASEDLIGLYRCVQSQDPELFDFMDVVNQTWKRLEYYARNDCETVDGIYVLYQKYLTGLIDDALLKQEIEEYLKKHEWAIQSFVEPLQMKEQEFFPKELGKTLLSKLKRMKVLHNTKHPISQQDIKDNIEGCFKASFYMYMRFLYNHKEEYTVGKQAFLYLFIRDMCYSSMFRFNANGEYNVPYGGISYNRKNYDKTMTKYQDADLMEHLSNATIGCMDYLEFLKQNPPATEDFMFLDPPYDSEFSTYDQNLFGNNEQARLADYLINECPCRFMLVIKFTWFISTLYEESILCHNGNRLQVEYFDKNYSVSFMNRNEKQVQHMLIKNY